MRRAWLAVCLLGVGLCSTGCAHWWSDGTQGRGPILFSSNFSEQGEERWWGGESAELWIEDEELHLLDSDADAAGSPMALLPGEYNDFVLEVDVRYAEASSGFLAYIVLRRHDTTVSSETVRQFYVIGVGQAGLTKCYLWFYDGDAYEKLAEEPCHGLDVTGGWNEVTIKADQYYLEVAVNGAVVLALHDTNDVSSGTLALWSGSHAGGTAEIAFDNLSVFAVE